MIIFCYSRCYLNNLLTTIRWINYFIVFLLIEGEGLCETLFTYLVTWLVFFTWIVKLVFSLYHTTYFPFSFSFTMSYIASDYKQKTNTDLHRNRVMCMNIHLFSMSNIQWILYTKALTRLQKSKFSFVFWDILTYLLSRNNWNISDLMYICVQTLDVVFFYSMMDFVINNSTMSDFYYFF